MPPCTPFDRQLEHLTTLAKSGEAWLPYVRRRAKDLEQDPSGLWLGLIAAITARLQHTDDQTPTKPG